MPALTALGWDARRSGDYQAYDRPDQTPGRVCRVEHGVCTLLGSDGIGRASVAGTLLATAAQDAARLPCPGDWVVVRRWPDARPTIEAVLPRRGILWRLPGARPSASNVDLMVTIDGSADLDSHLAGALRAVAARGHTLGVIGADPRARAALVAALAGAAVLPPPSGVLVALPGGGAVIDLVHRGRAGRAPAPSTRRPGPFDIDLYDIEDHLGGSVASGGPTCPDAR